MEGGGGAVSKAGPGASGPPAGAARAGWWEPFTRRALESGRKYAVEVNCVVSPHEIWATTKADLGLRDRVVDFLNSAEFLENAQRVEEAVRQFPPYRPGMACVAKVAEWGIYARAETCALPEPAEDGRSWGVRLVDFGDVFAVPSRFLLLVPRGSELCRAPALAIKTSLDNVGWRDGGEGWSESAVAQLKRYLSKVRDMEPLQPALREEGEDPYWLKHYVDYTIPGGGSAGKSLTTAFIYEGHAVYTTHPERRIVAGGVLKTLALWDFPPLPGVSLPHNEYNRIRLTIGNYDQRQGKVAVCVDDPGTAQQKAEVGGLINLIYVGSGAPLFQPSEARPGALVVIRYQRPSPDGHIHMGYYRAQIRGLLPGPSYHVYLIDEAVEIPHVPAADAFQMAKELYQHAPLAIPAVLHAFHNPAFTAPLTQPSQRPRMASKVEAQMDQILRHYVAKPGVVSMKIMTMNATDIEVVLYLAGFVHSLNDILLGFSGNERDKRWLEFLDHGGRMAEALEATGDSNPHPYVDSFFKAENYRRAMEAEGTMGLAPIVETPAMGRGTDPSLRSGPQGPGPAFAASRPPPPTATPGQPGHPSYGRMAAGATPPTLHQGLSANALRRPISNPNAQRPFTLAGASPGTTFSFR